MRFTPCEPHRRQLAELERSIQSTETADALRIAAAGQEPLMREVAVCSDCKHERRAGDSREKSYGSAASTAEPQGKTPKSKPQRRDLNANRAYHDGPNQGAELVTREEQDTERQLVRAETDWLKARGWTLAVAGAGTLQAGARFAHPELRGPIDYRLRDALALTRAEPLRFRRR
jgi:hypothetical protein